MIRFAKYIFSFITLFLSAASYCQLDSVTYFFDGNGALCSKQKAVYIAKGIKDDDRTKLIYYVEASGKQVMEATYTDPELS